MEDTIQSSAPILSPRVDTAIWVDGFQHGYMRGVSMCIAIAVFSYLCFWFVKLTSKVANL